MSNLSPVQILFLAMLVMNTICLFGLVIFGILQYNLAKDQRQIARDGLKLAQIVNDDTRAHREKLEQEALRLRQGVAHEVGQGLKQVKQEVVTGIGQVVTQVRNDASAAREDVEQHRHDQQQQQQQSPGVD